MTSHPNATLLVFIAGYAALAVGHLFSFKINRTGIALLGAILMVTVGGFPPHQALLAVNFPTLITLYALMILSGQLWLSGFFTWVAQKIASALDRPKVFLFQLMAASALLSAFLINDVVCLAFTPVVTLAVLRKGLNPLPFLMGLALAANIGAAATPIGNPQNIMVSSMARLHFSQYLLWSLPPTLLALAAAYGLTWALGRKDLKTVQAPRPLEEAFPVLDRRETTKGLLLFGIVVALFFTPLPRDLVMLSAAGILLLSRRISSTDLLGRVDYSILTLFTGLFIIVGGLRDTAFPAMALRALQSWGVDPHNPYLLTLVTAAFSNLMSNAATVMLLAKTLSLQDTATAMVLALSNSFAGNLLIIGSIANLIVAEQAARYGVEIRFRAFARYGLPVTAVSLAILMGWIWLRLRWG
ncbi:anion transporter [Deltaproteobacteria bacterium PRO3]|nr:anion transporter [Deltaproteobacteria bacterium PRO3]